MPPPNNRDYFRFITAPSLRGIDPWTVGNPAGQLHQLLGDDDRARLAAISTVVRFRKGQALYAEGDDSRWIFNIISGMVGTFHADAGGRHHIAAFLNPGDICGLAEEGRYVSSAEAITPVAAYAISTSSLRRLLSKDGLLNYKFVVMLSQGLRRAQRHIFLLGNKEALVRLALFLQLQQNAQAARGDATNEIYLPMSRTNISEYVDLSLAAVSRGFNELVNRQIISFRNRDHVKILDPRAFNRIARRANFFNPVGTGHPLEHAFHELNSCTSLEKAVSHTLDTAIRLVKADRGDLQLPANGALRIVASRGFDRSFLEAFREVHPGDGSACARAFEQREPIVIPDVLVDRQFAPFRAVAKAAKFRGVVTMPLITDQTLVGLVSTHFREPHSPSSDQLKNLEAFCQAAARRIESLQHETTGGRQHFASAELPMSSQVSPQPSDKG